MTHLLFITGAYAATVGTFAALSLNAAHRLRSARRRLLAIEKRERRCS